MLKSRSSSPISSRIARSFRWYPRDGFVSYQASRSRGSTISGTDHSAHPAFAFSPESVAALYFTNTVPELTGVGGVPQNIVCGFLLSVTVYFRADSCES